MFTDGFNKIAGDVSRMIKAVAGNKIQETGLRYDAAQGLKRLRKGLKQTENKGTVTVRGHGGAKVEIYGGGRGLPNAVHGSKPGLGSASLSPKWNYLSTKR